MTKSVAITTSIVILIGSCCPSVACPIPVDAVETTAAKMLPIKKLFELMTCSATDPINDKSPCNTFAGRGLQAIYHVSDFQDGRGGYLSANQISDFVAKSAAWHSLGGVLDAGNNLCAQTLANHAHPVVAVLKKSVHGHVALILPGTVAMSTSWGMAAANSASFLFEKPAKSYIDGPLSKSLQKEDAQNASFFYRAESSE